jgi:hypothetical protein
MAVSGEFTRASTNGTYTVSYFDANGAVALTASLSTTYYYVAKDSDLYKIFDAVYTPNKDVTITGTATAASLFHVTIGAAATGDVIELKGTTVPTGTTGALKEIQVGLPNENNSTLPDFVIPPGGLGDGSTTYSYTRIVVNNGAYLNINSDQAYAQVFSGGGGTPTAGNFNSGNITVMAGGKLRDSAYKMWPLGNGSTISVLEGGFLAVGPGDSAGNWADSAVTGESATQASAWYDGWLIGDSNAKIHLGGVTTESFVEAIEVRDGYVLVNGYATVKQDISLMYDVLLTRGSQVVIESGTAVTMLPGKAGSATYDFYGQPSAESPSYTTPSITNPSTVTVESTASILGSSLSSGSFTAGTETTLVISTSSNTAINEAAHGYTGAGTFTIFEIPTAE